QKATRTGAGCVTEVSYSHPSVESYQGGCEIEFMNDFPLTRAQAFEASEDVGRNASDNPTLGDVIAARFSRRDLLKGTLGVAAISATVSPLALTAADRAHAQNGNRFKFDEVAAGVDENHHVAAGYD